MGYYYSNKLSVESNGFKAELKIHEVSAYYIEALGSASAE